MDEEVPVPPQLKLPALHDFRGAPTAQRGFLIKNKRKLDEYAEQVSTQSFSSSRCHLPPLGRPRSLLRAICVHPDHPCRGSRVPIGSLDRRRLGSAVAREQWTDDSLVSELGLRWEGAAVLCSAFEP